MTIFMLVHLGASEEEGGGGGGKVAAISFLLYKGFLRDGIFFLDP